MDLEQDKWKTGFENDTDAVILDVRTPEEYEISRIPNSVNIDFYNPEIFMQEIGKLDKIMSYYIYCRTGVRSANSCHLMKELGFTKTYNLIGGIVDWNGETIS
ncbi:MAG: rhodanese-like domain-containing protein [Flavobacteriaceae bacterium]|nr:rhodanese-like domain-containing protein [Flavobacteriaceae bacterium]